MNQKLNIPMFYGLKSPRSIKIQIEIAESCIWELSWMEAIGHSMARRLFQRPEKGENFHHSWWCLGGNLDASGVSQPEVMLVVRLEWHPDGLMFVEKRS